MEATPITIVSEVRIVTAASVWIVRPATYLRLPRAEAPRSPIDDLDGASADGRWHDHDGAWFVEQLGCRKLQLLPSGRPPGSRGLISGPIEEVQGH